MTTRGLPAQRSAAILVCGLLQCSHPLIHSFLSFMRRFQCHSQGVVVFASFWQFFCLRCPLVLNWFRSRTYQDLEIETLEFLFLWFGRCVTSRFISQVLFLRAGLSTK